MFMCDVTKTLTYARYFVYGELSWKMVPHEILLWFPVHWAMLVQKLHDATLASLSDLKISRWRPRLSP